MSSEVHEYTQLCQKNSVKPNEEVVAALKAAGETGELNLSRKTLSAWVWESLGRIISSSVNIRVLNLSDCLIPPRGLTALLVYLSRDCSVDSLILRGNAIQTTNVAYLGTVLRQNCSLKRLSLEWNSIGIFVDAFSQFCKGLAVNETLDFLDLKNNQLPPECGQYLSDALKHNTSLKTLDIRWNNLGWKGGHYLHEALQSNQTVTKIELVGNCMSDDLMKSVEQCAKHNAARERIQKDFEIKTDFLKRHMKKLEEERTNEVQELSRSNEMRIRQVVRENESRVSQLEGVLSERAATINVLQERLTAMERTVKQQDGKIADLENLILEKDRMYQVLEEDCKQMREEWEKKLEGKAEQIHTLVSEHDTKLAAEINQKKQMELRITTQGQDTETLAAETLRLNETLKAVRKKYQGVPRFERPMNQGNTKQALTQMLRMRLPSNQYLPTQQPPPSFPQTMQWPQFIRQQIRAQHGAPGMQPPPQQGIFPQQQGGPNMYTGMQQGMSQNYAGYGGQPGPQMVPQQQLMGQAGQGMMGGFPGQQNGGFVSQQQPPGMMGASGPMAPQQPRGAGEYMGPQGGMTAQQRALAVQQGARPPYLQAPNVTMTTLGGPMGQQGQGQPQPAPPYGRAGGGGPQGPPPPHAAQQQNQQFQQQRMRQQMMAVQQPNQQAPALVAHLQRQLSQQQPGGNQPNQQHNPYSHQPPPY